MLELKNVVKQYKDGTHTITIFRDLTAALAEGSLTGVIGPSGAGKSTLLRIINKLERIDSGSLSLFGQADSTYSVQEWRTLIGFAFQQPVMLEGTVKDNVLVGPSLHNIPFSDEQCLELMREVGLEEALLHKEAKDLSGGEQQRVALIRALALKPKLLLLDEVTAALDDNNKRSVEECIVRRNKENNLTVLWVTHDLDQLRRIMQEVWFVSEGNVLQYESPEALFARTKGSDIQQFLQYQTLTEEE